MYKTLAHPIVIVLALFQFSIVAPAYAGPMSVDGQFAVSEMGAATYMIPIQVPPGTGGMEPKLALAYNSQAGNGLLGVGWNLSGLSAITRCPQTMAQDGVRGGVNYDANDRYCLDGQRLIAISGTNGGNGTEYRTERESFSKIVSYGSAGNGPASFKMWTRDGLVMEYGATANSAIEAQGKTSIAVWAVNKVSDTKGNYFTVTYTEDNANGAYYPARIDYTGNANTGLAPNNSVQFSYEARPDVETAYQAGSINKVLFRLNKVQTYVNSTVVRSYALTFQSSPHTNRSQMTGVQMCSTTGCLPSTEISWLGGGFGGGPAQNVVTSVFASDSNGPGYPNAGTQAYVDVNGDGKADFCRLEGGSGNYSIYCTTNLGSGGAPQNVVTTGFNSGPGHNNASTRAYVDVNGDGIADFCRLEGPTGGSYYIYCTTNLGRRGDLVNSIGTVQGGFFSFSHLPLTNNSVYTKGSGSLYPRVDLQLPLYVVSSVSTPNGIGGTLTTSCKYGGLMAELGTGRGLLGFAWQESTQAETGLTTRTENRQDWPYVGLASQVTVSKQGAGNGGLLKKTDISNGCLDPASGGACTVAAGKRYFPYASQSVETNWDLNGTVFPTVTTTQQFDVWGNPTVVKVSTSDGYEKITTNTYSNDVSKWFLGRLLRSKVQSTAP